MFRPSRMESVGSAVSGITLVDDHIESAITHGDSLPTQSRGAWHKRFFKNAAVKKSLVAQRLKSRITLDTKTQYLPLLKMKHYTQSSPWIVSVFVLAGQMMPGDGTCQRQQAQCMIDTGNHQGNIVSKDFVLKTLKIPESKFLKLTADEKLGGISATGHNLLPSGAIHLDWYYDNSPHIFRDMRFLVAPNPSCELTIGAQSIAKHRILSVPNLTITKPLGYSISYPDPDDLPKAKENELVLPSRLQSSRPSFSPGDDENDSSTRAKNSSLSTLSDSPKDIQVPLKKPSPGSSNLSSATRPEFPICAHVIFANEMRNNLKDQQLSSTDVTKIISESWQNLSAGKRESYEAQAFIAKDKYTKELAEHRAIEDYRNHQAHIKEMPFLQTPNFGPREPKADPQIESFNQLPTSLPTSPDNRECSVVSSDGDLQSSRDEYSSEPPIEDLVEPGNIKGFGASVHKAAIEEATAKITSHLSAFAISHLQKTIESTFIQYPHDNQKSSPGPSSGANGSRSKGKQSGNQQDSKKRRKMTEDGDYENGDNEGDENEDNGGPGNGKNSGPTGDPPRYWGCMFYALHPDRYHFKIDKKFKSCSTKPFRRLDELLNHILTVHGYPELLCPTCRLVFSQDKLLEHIMECDVRGPALIKLGIDSTVRDKLTALGRKSRNMSSDDRWNQLANIIFPGETPPPPDFEEGAKRVEEFKIYLQENLRALAEKHVPRAIERLRLDDQIMCVVQVALKEIFEHLSTDVVQDAFEGFRTHKPEAATRCPRTASSTIPLPSRSTSKKGKSKAKESELPALQIPTPSMSSNSHHIRPIDHRDLDSDRPVSQLSNTGSDYLSKYAVHYTIPNHSSAQSASNRNASQLRAFPEPEPTSSNSSARILTPNSQGISAPQSFNSSDNEGLQERYFGSDESVSMDHLFGGLDFGDLDFDTLMWPPENFRGSMDRDGNSGEES